VYEKKLQEFRVLATWDIRSEKAVVRRKECAYTDCKWMCTENTI